MRSMEVFVGSLGGVLVGLWASVPVAVQLLIAMMIIDIASGIFAAAVQKRLSSEVSWGGLARKGLVLLLVAMAAVLQGHLPQAPLAQVVAGFYVAHEAISILENVTAAGLPVPPGLVEMLAQLRDGAVKSRKKVTDV